MLVDERARDRDDVVDLGTASERLGEVHHECCEPAAVARAGLAERAVDPALQNDLSDAQTGSGRDAVPHRMCTARERDVAVAHDLGEPAASGGIADPLLFSKQEAADERRRLAEPLVERQLGQHPREAARGRLAAERGIAGGK